LRRKGLLREVMERKTVGKRQTEYWYAREAEGVDFEKNGCQGPV